MPFIRQSNNLTCYSNFWLTIIYLLYRDFRISTSKNGNLISQDDDGAVMTQSFAKSVNQMYRNKSPYVHNRNSNDQYPEPKL